VARGAGSPDDEAFWSEIQRAFDVDRTMINLNNAGLSPTPAVAMDQMIRDIRFTNELPQEHLLRTLEPRAETVRRELAEEFGCDAEEIALTRNATESNMTMIFGVDLKRGDEVIFTTQNYPRMISAWRQRERRDGLVLKPVVVPTPVPSNCSALMRRRIASPRRLGSAMPAPMREWTKVRRLVMDVLAG
jgi:selenocysteine lyase/cysteine desulfurase